MENTYIGMLTLPSIVNRLRTYLRSRIRSFSFCCMIEARQRGVSAVTRCNAVPLRGRLGLISPFPRRILHQIITINRPDRLVG